MELVVTDHKSSQKIPTTIEFANILEIFFLVFSPLIHQSPFVIIDSSIISSNIVHLLPDNVYGAAAAATQTACGDWCLVPTEYTP